MLYKLLAVDRADRRAGHAFISYAREDGRRVDALQRTLEAAGIPVWRDTLNLWPGEDWRAGIRRAIRDDALVFIACFSRASLERDRSYQNEELALAIEQLRLRRPDVPWLIPVRFDECDIPDRDVGGGRTLSSIQRADLFGADASDRTARLVAAVHRILGLHADNARGGSDPMPSALAGAPSVGGKHLPGPQGDSGQAGRRLRETWVGIGVSVVLAVAVASSAPWWWKYVDLSSPAPPSACIPRHPAPSHPWKMDSFSTGTGRTAGFVSAQFSPNGTILATGGGNGTVKLWDVATCQRTAVLDDTAATQYVFSLAFTSDGKILAAAAGDGTVKLWDVASLRRIATLPATPGGATYSASISSVGNLLATGGSDGIARLWRATTGQKIAAIPTGSAVGSLALSPNGKVLAVGGADGNDRLWDTASRKRIAVFPGKQGHVFSVAFSPNGKVLVAGTYNGYVQWWDVTTGALIAAKPTDYGSADSVVFSQGGKILAVGSNGIVELWNAATHHQITILKVAPPGKWPQGLAFSKNGRILAVGINGTAQLWNIANLTNNTG